MLATVRLVTPQLHLRPLVRSDGPALFEVLGDPEVMTYWSSAHHQSEAQTCEYILANAEDPGFTTWAITEDGGQALGWVTLVHVRAGVAEIGFILHRSRWGRGYVSEAARAVIDHGFAAMKLRRIQADIDPDNLGSIRVVERLGFSYEGRMRAAWATHLGIRDSVLYARLATDA